MYKHSLRWMEQRFVEESVLFFSVLKWFIIASVIGALVGSSTALFLKLLGGSLSYSHQWPWYFLLLPVAMMATVWINHKLSPESAGHGTEKVIDAIHRKSGRIKARVVPIKLATTIMTLASGGSVGKEGPCAQIGGGLASLFADLCRFSDTARRKLVVCGVSAGFAAVFGTPIAGSLFGVEVLAIGQMQYEVLYPSFIAGIVGFQVARMLGVEYFHNPIQASMQFSDKLFLEVVLLGVLFGLCSFCFIEMTKLMKSLSDKLNITPPKRGFIGGCAVVLIVLITDTRYLGLGIETIEQLMTGEYTAQWFDPWMKMLTTSLTLEFGGSGGIITPIMFVGSAFGSFLAGLLHQDPIMLAGLGMVGVLAGCTNTPVAASIMAIELFGPHIGLYAATVCVISFVMTGHRSVYPSQILSIKKSESLIVELGHPVDEAEYCAIRKAPRQNSEL